MTLAGGSYTITATVTEGDQTVSDSVGITVFTAPPPPNSISVEIHPLGGPYVKNDIVTIEVHVANGGDILGATVNVTLNTPKGRTLTGSATTDSNGDATLTYKVNTGRDGKGTFNVAATATLSGVTSNEATVSFLVQ